MASLQFQQTNKSSNTLVVYAEHRSNGRRAVVPHVANTGDPLIYELSRHRYLKYTAIKLYHFPFLFLLLVVVKWWLCLVVDVAFRLTIVRSSLTFLKPTDI